MPLHKDDVFVGSDLHSMPLSDMQGAVIGVDATYYLQNFMLGTALEPLQPALGGEPVKLSQCLREELDRWDANHITPLFVFEGRSIAGKRHMDLSRAKEAIKGLQTAWELYASNKAADSVKAFGKSGASTAASVCHVFQQILQERDLEFIVSPGSACAQLAYLDLLDSQYVDGILGSQELLLYNISDAIIKFPSEEDWEQKVFFGVIRSELLTKLKIPPGVFSDALLMIGTSFLAPFPPLRDPHFKPNQQPLSITDAVDLLRVTEQSVTNACAAFADTIQLLDVEWLVNYQKAKMSIKHCITMSHEGAINILDYKHLTSDHVGYLGLQLPAELHHYFSRGLIGSRTMDCLGSLESVVFPTLDCLILDEYKDLVTRCLVPIKETTIALIFSRMHRGFQFQDVKLRLWYEEESTLTLRCRNNIQLFFVQQVDSWGVKAPLLKIQQRITGQRPGTLSFALLSLSGHEFPPQTITLGKAAGLRSHNELICNILWRFLHLRGYIDDRHNLTGWGRALAKALEIIRSRIHNDAYHAEEGAFLAFELVRFNCLNTRNRHQELIGGPIRGSDQDKLDCLLVSRTCCLLKLRLGEIPYTGPLSRNLLSFCSLIKGVRETDRDLVEGITASILLNNQGTRSWTDSDYRALSRSLPFLNDIDVAFGIAVKTYLDDIIGSAWTAQEGQSIMSLYQENFFPTSIDIGEDLGVGFQFFDAVCAGIKTLGDEMSEDDKKAWSSAEAYLTRKIGSR